MKIRFENLAGVFTHIESFDLHEITKYAEENNVVVGYETIKANIRKRYDERKQKYHFFRPFRTELPLTEHLNDLFNQNKRRRKK